MKALLLNPESISAFWSMPKARKISGARVLTQPLGLITVAALLPREWEVRLVDVAARRVTEEEWNWSEVVMITGMIAQRPSFLALAREAKTRGKTVVVGGPFATSLPDRALEAGCDFLVSGEAEETMADLVAAIENGAKSGIFESPDRPDLRTSPTPRFDLVELTDYASISVQTSRGCPHDCEFCDIVNLYGRTPRYKSPEQMIQELETLYRLGWRSEVFISDDNFIGNPAHARALLHELIPWMKSHGEPFVFWTQASVNLGRDAEMIDLMTEANFSTVFIGIESPDEEVLAITGKYQNIRHPMLESLDTINRNGLTAMASFVLGLDGEQEGVGDRIVSFVEASRIPAVLINTLCAVPNTRLWNRLIEEGRLSASPDKCDGTGGPLNYVATRPEQDILKEHADACALLFEPRRFLDRAYQYYLAMRPTRKALGREESSPEPRLPVDAGRSLRRTFWDVVGFFRLVWWQGIRPPYRLVFWKQLFGMWRRNPSRLVAYLKMCALGENLFALREAIAARAQSILAGESAGPRSAESTEAWAEKR